MQKTVASLESFTSFKTTIYLAIFVVITTVLLEIQVFWDVQLFSQNKPVALCHMSHDLQFFQYCCLRRGPG